MKIRVLVRPKAGILDPQGEAVKNALPALGFEGVRTVHVGRLVEMEVESRDEVDAMCRRLLSNPTIEEYEWEVVGVRIGVTVFPGSNCDRDALYGVERMGAEAVELWHADADLKGVDAVIVPGGFSYGDYLQTRRHRPLCERHGPAGRVREGRRPGTRRL